MERKADSGKGKIKVKLGFSVLKWLFESEDNDAIIQALRQYRDSISVGLNIDQTYVACAFLEAYLSLMSFA